MRLASRIGLAGLTIGRLADELKLSKSGLFAHFRSKEALQVQVLEAAGLRFVEKVVRPGLQKPRGLPRLRALFEGWLAWDRSGPLPGGCIFVAASSEVDDDPGPVRDRLVRLQREWLEVLAQVVQSAIAEGHFRRQADADQFAHDLYGIMLAHHHAVRLLRDPRAEERVNRAFETLVRNGRKKSAA